MAQYRSIRTPRRLRGMGRATSPTPRGWTLGIRSFTGPAPDVSGNAWTNEQLLWHMVFGHIIVLRLLPLVRFFGPRLVRLFDRVVASLHRHLDQETEQALHRSMHFPVGGQLTLDQPGR